MKKSRFSLVIVVSILAALLLSSCAGGSIYNTWPGLSAQDDVVYVSYMNGVFAVRDGSMLWRYPDKPDNNRAFYAPVAFANGTVVVADYSNNLAGLDAQNGAQRWMYTHQDETPGHFVGAPLIVGETVLAPSSDHQLYAFDMTGKPKWTFETGNILWGQPASDGEVVFLPAMDHNLYALRLADGSQAWKQNLGGALPSLPVLADDGVLYIANLKGQVYAIDPSSGEARWEADVDGEVWATPLLVGDALFVGSSNGRVYRISTQDGQVLGETDLGSPVIAGGALLGENAIFPTEGGTLYALNPQGQTTSWKPSVNGKLYTTPVVVNDQLVVAVKDGDRILAAFDQNGTEVWSFSVPE